MPNKVQGEGDYESARRYNQHVVDSVKKGQSKDSAVPPGTSVKSLEKAEQDGKARAKQGDNDATDAKLMKQYVEDNADDE